MPKLWSQTLAQIPVEVTVMSLNMLLASRVTDVGIPTPASRRQPQPASVTHLLGGRAAGPAVPGSKTFADYLDGRVTLVETWHLWASASSSSSVKWRRKRVMSAPIGAGHVRHGRAGWQLYLLPHLLMSNG